MALPTWQCGEAALGFNPDPADDAHWHALDVYAALFDKRLTAEALRPLDRVLAVARAGGCRTIVVERNYIDLDYRSEYSAFWSRLFADKPSLVPRLHFFASELGAADVHRIPTSDSYLGYSVLRPTEMGPVGRTLLVPPPEAQSAILTTVTEEPSLFGTALPVTGVPFYQQDGQLMRCAHVVAWIAHYAAASFASIPRVPTGQLALMPQAASSRYRPLPASGLTMEQLQHLLTSVGLPALLYEVNDLAPVPGRHRHRYTRLRGIGPPHRLRQTARNDYRDRITRVVCKYLNSGLPVIVLTSGQHAFTLVGWERREDGEIRLWACDDQLGPFKTVDPLDISRCGAWESLMVPAPEKVLLAGEAAERRALDLLAAAGLMSSNAKERRMASLSREVRPTGPTSVRARLMEGTAYKAQLDDRGLPDDVVRMFRLADLSHWVWTVEVHDRQRRDRGEHCVKAEIVFDSTSHDDDPSAHLLLTPTHALDVAVYQRQEVRVGGPDSGLAEQAFDPWRSLISTT